MPTKIPIPNKLRFFRKQAGLRQIDVAARLGFKSYERISHWEQGIAFPSVTNLFKLAALYRTTAQEMYEEIFEMNKNKLAATSATIEFLRENVHFGKLP